MARAATAPASGPAGPADPRGDMARIRQQNAGEAFLKLDEQTMPSKKDMAFAAADILASTPAMVPATGVGKPGLAYAGSQTLFRMIRNASCGPETST